MSDGQKKIVAGAVAVVAVVLMVSMLWKTVGPEPPTPADTRVLMDAKTGELFKIPTEDVKHIPLENPKTGEKTLYLTEVCYWGPECRKAGGTRVIMNELLGKEGPTYCPVCKHIVRFHNPLPPDYHPGEKK